MTEALAIFEKWDQLAQVSFVLSTLVVLAILIDALVGRVLNAVVRILRGYPPADEQLPAPAKKEDSLAAAVREYNAGIESILAHADGADNLDKIIEAYAKNMPGAAMPVVHYADTTAARPFVSSSAACPSLPIVTNAAPVTMKLGDMARK